MTGDMEFRKFAQRRLLCYFIPNVFFNTCVPYFTFKNMNAVYLFQGELCFARLLLPMAFFLPFIITLDLLKKTVALSEKGRLSFELPEGLGTNKFLFRKAGVNGVVTLTIAGLTTLFVQVCVPNGYSFDGTVLSVALGLIAAVITLIFTFLALQLVIPKDSPLAV